jgi:hypothetical protein
MSVGVCSLGAAAPVAGSRGLRRLVGYPARRAGLVLDSAAPLSSLGYRLSIGWAIPDGLLALGMRGVVVVRT